jgi:hypothetical protein
MTAACPRCGGQFVTKQHFIDEKYAAYEQRGIYSQRGQETPAAAEHQEMYDDDTMQ